GGRGARAPGAEAQPRGGRGAGPGRGGGGRAPDPAPGTGLSAPPGRPPAVIPRLQQAIAQSLPELKPRFEASGGEPMEMPPDKLGAFVASEHHKWTEVIRDAGISLE